jgi:hypothetical protein
MRSVGVRALPSRFPVARRRICLLHSARNNLSKISQALCGTSRGARQLGSSSRTLYFAKAGRQAVLILFICPVVVLAAACANAPPEAKSWQFTAVPVDRADLPPIPDSAGTVSGWRTIVSGSALTRQSTGATGWRTEVNLERTHQTEMAVISARE